MSFDAPHAPVALGPSDQKAAPGNRATPRGAVRLEDTTDVVGGDGGWEWGVVESPRFRPGLPTIKRPKDDNLWGVHSHQNIVPIPTMRPRA